MLLDVPRLVLNVNLRRIQETCYQIILIFPYILKKFKLRTKKSKN